MMEDKGRGSFGTSQNSGGVQWHHFEKCGGHDPLTPPETPPLAGRRWTVGERTGGKNVEEASVMVR